MVQVSEKPDARLINRRATVMGMSIDTNKFIIKTRIGGLVRR